MLFQGDRKTSYVWHFFEEVDESTILCKLCDKKMSKNMYRHMRLIHPNIYQQMRHCRLRGDKSTPQKVKSRDLHSKGTKSKHMIQQSKGTNWAKKYVNKIGDKRFQCNICETGISSNGLFINVKRHIRNKHPYIYYKEMNKIKCGTKEVEKEEDVENYLDEYIEEARKSLDARRASLREEEEQHTEEEAVIGREDVIVEEIFMNIHEDNSDKQEGIGTLSELDPEFEEKVKFLCNKIVMGKNKVKNPIWNFFDVIEYNHVYVCITCKKQLSIFPGSFGNLKRHIRGKHKTQYEIMMKYIKENEHNPPISFDKFYFAKQTDGQYRCKKCGDIITCSGNEQHVLFEHFKVKHLMMNIGYQDEHGQTEDDDDDEYSVVIIKKKDMELCDSAEG